MDSFPIAWGLDIGHSSIKAVKLSRTSSGVTVLGYAIEPIVVPEGGDRDQALSAALQALVAREEFGTTPVFAAISGRQVFSRPVNIPVIQAKKMRTMVEMEARMQIPGNFDEVEWGFHSSPAADGVSQDVALFAVKREVTEQLIGKCKDVGINLAGVSVPSLALYNFIKYDQEFPAGEAVIILDVGAENTDLVIYQDEQLWMRSLTTSGNDITQVFAKKFRVSVAEAETLKRQVTDSRQADKIIKVIESGLTELVSEINRNLGFYRSQNANATLDNLVISGNTFRLPGLPEYMAEKLRLTVNILEDLDRIQVAPGLDRSHFLHDLQGLGVAMGLALQATGAARTNVNLIPSGMQTEKILDSKKWAPLAVIAILGLSVWIEYGFLSNLTETNRRLADKVVAYAESNRQRMHESETVLTEVQQLAPKLAILDVAGANQGLAHAVLAGVNGVIQEVALQKDLAPSQPEGAGIDAPRVAAVYLHSISLPRANNNSGKAADPFLPLATARTVMVQVDVPIGPRQSSIPELVMQKLRQLETPAQLRDLVKTPTLFSDVQARDQASGQLDWWYLDRQRVNKDGNVEKIENRQNLPTITMTYACTLAAATATTAGTTEAKP